MSQDEQEKQPVEQPTPPAPEEPKQQEDNATDGDDTPKDPASESEPNEIDYKAELEVAQAAIAQKDRQIGQAEHTIEELKKANKQPNEQEQPNEEGDAISAEEFEKQILEKARGEFQSQLKEVVGDVFEEELSKLSSNPDEQALIKFHYENTIRQSGFTRKSIQADLETAKVLANRKKVLVENEELKEALKAKNSTSNSSRGTNQDKKEPVTITDEDRRIANKFFGGDVQRYLKSKKNN